jgi:hypothetical protein
MNAMTINIPQFTFGNNEISYKKYYTWNQRGRCKRTFLPAGGRSEALIATPTRLDVESSSTDRATPRPEKNAIGN